MALGSWATTESTVFGNMRVLVGTLTATDGADSTANTGLLNIFWAGAQSEVGLSNTAGILEPLTAASGALINCIVIGN